MAPRKTPKVASAPAKSSKAAATLQKSSTPASLRHGISKKQPRSDRSARRAGQDFEYVSAAVAGSSKKPVSLKKSTSFATRRKQRPRMNISEIMAESARGDLPPEDYSTNFGAGSTALHTWGKAASQPVPAVGSLRRHKRYRLFGGRNSDLAKLTFGVKRDDRAIISFRFLDLPLEIRWMVYGHLLIQPNPVLVYPDWQTVHTHSPQDHSILRVNKQVFLESSQFLYEKNVFRAVVNSKRLAVGSESNLMTRYIKSPFLLFLKNVILECNFNFYGKGQKDQLGGTVKCLKTLVATGACLHSVTLAVSIMRFVEIINSAQPSVIVPLPSFPQPKGPVYKAISEFFKAPSSVIMRVIPKLHCKVLNIVLRISERERVVVSINLRDLPASKDKDDWFANEKTARRSARNRKDIVRAELRGLSKRLEDIFEDYEKAIMEGKARLMTQNESLADGLQLANPATGQST